MPPPAEQGVLFGCVLNMPKTEGCKLFIGYYTDASCKGRFAPCLRDLYRNVRMGLVRSLFDLHRKNG
jgi:hypothetical protein